jgi:hypothetical protein
MNPGGRAVALVAVLGGAMRPIGPPSTGPTAREEECTTTTGAAGLIQ